MLNASTKKSLLVFILAVFITLFISTPAIAESTSSFNLLDANERGTNEEGLAQGTAIATFDETLKKDVLEFDYSLAQGSRASVWAKRFPAELAASAVNQVKIGVKISNLEQVSQISVNVAIKGITGAQNIPIPLKRAGWNSLQKPIEWGQIGDLSEIVFTVSPVPSAAEPLKGTLSFSLDFLKQAVVKKAVSAPAQAAKASSRAPSVVAPVAPAKPKSSYTLFDAGERSVLKGDLAKGRGSVTSTFDEVVGKDVLEFDYSLPKGSSVQVVSKQFPLELKGPNLNTLKVGVRVSDSAPTKEVVTHIELKGTEGTQDIPLRLKSGWNSLLESIDWEKIGGLSEVSFAVKSTGDAGLAKGTLNFTIEFIKLSSQGQPKGKASAFTAYSLLDAGEKGVFNMGPSKGAIATTFDEATGKDVWTFDYSVPIGSVVGIWTKSYTTELRPGAVDAVRIGVHVPNAEQINQVSVKAEIKGRSGMQTIPLFLKPGPNSFGEAVNWNSVGELTEVVFVVSPKAANPVWFNPEKASETEATTPPITGTLSFDLGFGKLTPLEKNIVFIKVILVFLLALLIAFSTFFLSKFLPGKPEPPTFAATQQTPSIQARIKQDLFYGMMTVFIVGIALVIKSLGTVNPLDAGFSFTFLVVAVMGALISELLAYKLTGKHLTSLQAFQNVFLTGLLAVASSRQQILEAPSNWLQILVFSSNIAALTFLAYHLSNAYSLATSHKHLRKTTSILIVSTPYLFNWLLLLENANFVRTLTNGLTFGLLAAWPIVLETLGRFLVVFGFNEAVVNGISFATKGRLLKTSKGHVSILLVSLAVVVAPLIADLGSTPWVGSLPAILKALVAILTTMLSFGGFWAEVYLITGMLLDSGHAKAPSDETIFDHVNKGARKGMAYSGILLAILYVLHVVLSAQVSKNLMHALPIPIGILAGAFIFPFVKTIIETFDGSLPFFERVRFSYRDVVLYARGAVVGFGFAYMCSEGLFQQAMSSRIMFGLFIGLLASGGISFLRDAAYGFKGIGRVQSWRLYLIDSCLGIFVGAAMAFYLDSLQVPVVIEKFKLYTSAGFDPVSYITYPLVNKWGRIDLGTYSGGAKLLFTESLAGVINWSIAAWLFAINKVFMQAYFNKETAPIKFFFSKAGVAQLVEHMIYVLRWGLWMSPIIFTFLRMMPQATWYNRDGAIQTVFSIYNSVTMSPEAFQAWSLKTFVWLMAFDFFRVLIWMDHMGLRVATLVNLSFLGMDRLDEKVARWIGPAAAQRYIPEGVKRFTTWGPLLIPFYLPRGEAWDYAWSTSEAMLNASRGKGLLFTLQSFSFSEMLALIACAILICTGVSFGFRLWLKRSRKRKITSYKLANREYEVTVKENGESFSVVPSKEFFDVTRRAYDTIDPSGKLLFLLDAGQAPESAERFWPVLGNFPKDRFEASQVEKEDGSLKITNTSHGIETVVEIRLPDQDATAEIWTVTIKNKTSQARQLKVIPYVEWVLNGWIHDRFHTQYARLYPEMEYSSEVNAILTWHKATKSAGMLAVDIAPEGFLTSRVDFIGRAQSVWSPRIFETLNFREACDTASYPTFDPIGSLAVNVSLEARASQTVRLMLGYAKNKKTAVELIKQHLKPELSRESYASEAKKKWPLIGHGEILPGTPEPYSEFVDGGKKLVVRTPFTTRPYDHAMSNEVHSVMVTNRGLHTSCNGNSQQNRLTPDWPDTVTREVPAEAIYLYDLDQHEWYSPTYHPLNKKSATHISEFSVDGTSLFRMTDGSLSTELTVFVPPDDPLGVYLLTIKNNADHFRRMRVAPYFQMVLGFQPGSLPWESPGSLMVRHDKKTNALYFQNLRNMFRSGWAFASMSLPSDCVETKRGRFFGEDRGVLRPFMVEQGVSDKTQLSDGREVASFVGTVEIPAHGETTVAIVLGQADEWKDALRFVQKYKSLEAAREGLVNTRKWWLNLMETVTVESNHPEFDRLQNWLKYQALAERIWARRGFYQTSGAYGFRDQLQDTVNLIWVDPALARRQIILHASHQFVEGDVFHWFFTLTDGRTAFSCRSHASDNPVWLSWAVAEYLRATGDESILDEMASYAVSEFPFAPLPKNKQGWGHLYHRTTRADSIYKHCLKSIDLVLEKRMGKHGLPLMGTGDWNDGLDEIGSEGRGESVWLALFVCYILKNLLAAIEKKEGKARREHYFKKMKALESAIEWSWRGDRYLRAIHDDGTEIGVKDSGIWEIDALTAAWAVMAGINFERSVTVFDTALRVLEKGSAILLGWPALREDMKPYLGRSSKYPEGVRENGMYCHGVQWLVRAARVLAEEFERRKDPARASEYRAVAYRLWLKVSAIPHVTAQEIEIYGGQPNKQAADILTNFDPGRMIWHGYTGAAGWMLRQAFEGVVGASLIKNELVLPTDLDQPRGELKVNRVHRDVQKSPVKISGPYRGSKAGSISTKLHSKIKISAPEITIIPR